MTALKKYELQVNVRELRNVLERLMIMVPGDVIRYEHLGLPGTTVPENRLPDALDEWALTLHEARERFERDYIVRVWTAQHGNMSRTADVLGVERSNLYRKMKAFGILPARRGDSDDDPRDLVR
jgi:two-component system nitrogen regulation response regulator NtrX